jgi:7-cyano-7-deazaguanine synthase in queuosine biosynthesis
MQYTVTTSTGTKDVTVYWPKGVKRLGIMTSGGFDSALMLWMWAQYPVPEGCSLVAVATDRGLGAKEFAQGIVDKVNELLGTRIELLVLPVSNSTRHQQQVNKPANIAMRKGMFDCVISADTTNPTVSLPGVEPQRVTIEQQFVYDNWQHPFLHMDKSHTVQLVHDLDLDWIPKMSHTCTETADIRCGQCWQCNERAWAFNLLGLEDTGTF